MNTSGAAVLDPPESWLAHLITMVAFHAVPVALGMVRRARLALLHELTGPCFAGSVQPNDRLTGQLPA